MSTRTLIVLTAICLIGLPLTLVKMREAIQIRTGPATQVTVVSTYTDEIWSGRRHHTRYWARWNEPVGKDRTALVSREQFENSRPGTTLQVVVISDGSVHVKGGNYDSLEGEISFLVAEIVGLSLCGFVLRRRWRAAHPDTSISIQETPIRPYLSTLRASHTAKLPNHREG